ncbi:GNAT family N-acetyltransferase [Methylobacterium aerolatum]|uniref:RimJ/RimL family protein N-acetyltransferase n=1 Tax=Methylobacterium aerolatum TaxID=418708 RepID=A0ABU0HW22_9HYPH|nr:GNAT family N-acetyltransferase [Methylobacterium aerolatum]MDQ0446097.1 RimJ/RimL family protein N-acetyltransferase [Methylobacterium aerolatum]GJD35133.1 hypothetical protein FMGBMHLM_2041 [Methylobacterium aerolatum]
MEARHTQAVVRWRNEPEIARWFLTKHVFTAEGHLRWLEQAQQSGTDFNWVIEGPDGAPLGTIGLYDVDWQAGRAEIGRILVGEMSARGLGHARQAVEAILSAARDAGLREVHLVVKDENIGASKLYRSVGFTVSGHEDGSTLMAHDLN